MSTFSGLSTAMSGLFAQRRGLDVTGQNIANANTDGYSRQRADLESVGAPAQPAIFATYEGAGGGVNVADVQRLRDAFLETRAHTEHGRMAFLDERRTALSQVEDLLAEPGDSGLQDVLSQFWSAWDDLANKPGEAGENAAREQLLQRATTLVDGLDAAQNALGVQWASARTQLSALVDEVNTVAGNVTELNVAIRRSEQAGTPANELADQRDSLVLKLAQLTGATTRTGSDGMIDVYLGGRALVRGASSAEIAVGGGRSFSADALADPPVPVTLTWGDGYPAVVEQGKSAGLLDTLNGTLPTYGTGLLDFAERLASTVNAVHRTGYGRNDTGTTGSGRDFFATTTEGARIRVAIGADHLDDIAASRYPDGKIDGGTADLVARLSGSPDGPDAAYRSLVVDLGVDAQTARQRVTIQTTITGQVDAARDSEAGVEIDEEMVNMLAFQRAYEGSARMLTAVDQALDILINRTGMVGR